MSKTPNLLAPNTAAWPYWGNAGVQYPNLIAGQQLARELEDIGINRIPAQTDYEKADLRTIPTPGSPNQDIKSAFLLQTHQAELGRGASVSLMDMMNSSIKQTQEIGANK